MTRPTDAYRKANPLGGPATVFRAIAGRLEAGEDYYAVLEDYGLVHSESRWIDSSKKCPPDGDTVLCYWAVDEAHRMGAYMGEAEYNGGRWHNPEDDEDDYRVPTHWMPLPAAPAQSVGEEKQR